MTPAAKCSGTPALAAAPVQWPPYVALPAGIRYQRALARPHVMPCKNQGTERQAKKCPMVAEFALWPCPDSPELLPAPRNTTETSAPAAGCFGKIRHRPYPACAEAGYWWCGKPPRRCPPAMPESTTGQQ